MALSGRRAQSSSFLIRVVPGRQRLLALEPDVLSFWSLEGIIGSHKDGESPSDGVFYLEALRAGNKSWNQTMLNKIDLAYVSWLDFLHVVFDSQGHSKIELVRQRR